MTLHFCGKLLKTVLFPPYPVTLVALFAILPEQSNRSLGVPLTGGPPLPPLQLTSQATAGNGRWVNT